MLSVTILEAWRLWFHASLPEGAVLWGVTILWWGRAGKLAQFFGAALIVAEILGPEKLRRYGASLHQFSSLSFAKKTFEDAWRFASALLGNETNTHSDYVRVFSDYRTGIFAAAIGYLAAFIALYEIWMANLLWWQFILMALLMIFVMFAISPLLAIMGVLVIGLLGFIIDRMFIRPIASALMQPTPEKFVKVVSLVLLIAGFHFDILAS